MEEKMFHLQPWAPEIFQAAKDIIAAIHKIAPELEVLFMGSAALGLPGKNDIDLDILCKKEDVATYTRKLITVLGEPKEANDTLTAWEFERGGFEIDAILSDPTISHVPLQQKRYELLKSNPELRNEFKALKEACDGLPYAEYDQRKKAFLEEKVFSSKNLL